MNRSSFDRTINRRSARKSLANEKNRKKMRVDFSIVRDYELKRYIFSSTMSKTEREQKRKRRTSKYKLSTRKYQSRKLNNDVDYQNSYRQTAVIHPIRSSRVCFSFGSWEKKPQYYHHYSCSLLSSYPIYLFSTESVCLPSSKTFFFFFSQIIHWICWIPTNFSIIELISLDHSLRRFFLQKLFLRETKEKFLFCSGRSKRNCQKRFVEIHFFSLPFQIQNAFQLVPRQLFTCSSVGRFNDKNSRCEQEIQRGEWRGRNALNGQRFGRQWWRWQFREKR